MAREPRRGGRHDRRGGDGRAPCWRSATPSDSIRRSPSARPLVADPRFIEVHRLGVFPERSLDIDVVFDLMIHDLDVVLSLVGSEVESIDAVGVPVLTAAWTSRTRASGSRTAASRT